MAEPLVRVCCRTEEVRSSLVLWWGCFGRDLMRNEVGTSQMVGVERRKEPAVTGLLAQSLEGVGEKRRREGTADLDRAYATAAATLSYSIIQVKADYSLLSQRKIRSHQAVQKKKRTEESILHFN